MTYNIINKLPPGSGVIGTREIQKGITSSDIKHVIIASNCPEWLVNKLLNKITSAEGTSNTHNSDNLTSREAGDKITGAEGASNPSIVIEQFSGNEHELATALGKAFAIAMVGYKE